MLHVQCVGRQEPLPLRHSVLCSYMTVKVCEQKSRPIDYGTVQTVPTRTPDRQDPPQEFVQQRLSASRIPSSFVAIKGAQDTLQGPFIETDVPPEGFGRMDQGGDGGAASSLPEACQVWQGVRSPGATHGVDGAAVSPTACQQ